MCSPVATAAPPSPPALLLAASDSPFFLLVFKNLSPNSGRSAAETGVGPEFEKGDGRLRPSLQQRLPGAEGPPEGCTTAPCHAACGGPLPSSAEHLEHLSAALFLRHSLGCPVCHARHAAPRTRKRARMLGSREDTSPGLLRWACGRVTPPKLLRKPLSTITEEVSATERAVGAACATLLMLQTTAAVLIVLLLL